MKSNERIYAVSLIVDSTVGPGARHGLNKIRLALQEKGIPFQEVGSIESACGDMLIIAGPGSGSGPAAELLKSSDTQPPEGPESLLIRHIDLQGKKTLLVAGGDDRGLMYALLDVADRIGWESDPGNPLSEVRDIVEKPAVAERALSIYTMNKPRFESFFYNEGYWARYLDMLAESRFNTFTLMFADSHCYESAGQFAPPYPYLFDVDGFPEVLVVDITREQQQRSLRMLNQLIEMTHARGLDFTLAIWDHIHRPLVGNIPGSVTGLAEHNLVDYSTTALTKFLKLVPNLDSIQFRMHGESGLTKEELDPFWTGMYDVMKESGKGIGLYVRAKGFPDHLIDLAIEKGFDVKVCTKYWMEQLGLPYHPTHINRRNQFDRRHGYADLLKYPKRYKMYWRVWNAGTNRILLWGDPEYVRRFAYSTHLYDGLGYEVNEPLGTKMASHPHAAESFDLLTPEYQYYDWEFERYWHYFQVFGRLGYNPETPPEVWERKFESRFGKKAGKYVQRGVHLASQILPRIVTYNYPYNLFPTPAGWVEKQRMEDLPKYAAADPSDTQQFLKIRKAASNLLEGKESAKIHPLASSAWFERIGREVLAIVDQAEEQIGEGENREFVSTMVDLRILAHLALYHSRRACAGVSLVLFQHSQDLNVLDDAIRYESQAISVWEKIVEVAGDVYHHNFIMGGERVRLTGHWKDELVALQNGLKELQQQRKDFQPAVPEGAPLIAHVPIRKIKPGEDLIIRATVSGRDSIARVRVGYGASQDEYTYVSLEQNGQFLYSGTIPGSSVTEGLTYLVDAEDEAGRRATYPSGGKVDPIAVTVTEDNVPPTVTHRPITSAPAGKPLTITAEVQDPSGVKWMRLRYRSVTQFQEFQTLEMTPTGRKDEYKAVVPAEHVDPKWDFMYLIEVMDNKGNGKIYPDLEKETPYVIVKLERPRISGV